MIVMVKKFSFLKSLLTIVLMIILKNNALYALTASFQNVFDALDLTKEREYLSFTSLEGISPAEKIDFIHAYWRELSDLVHPVKLPINAEDDSLYALPTFFSGAITREGESLLSTASSITAILSLKKKDEAKSRVLLYDKDHFVASTSINGSTGDFNDMYAYSNQFGLPWATRGSLRLWARDQWGKRLEKIGKSSVVTAAAFCDSLITAAVIEAYDQTENRLHSTMLYVGSPFGIDDLHGRMFRARLSCKPLAYTRTQPYQRSVFESAFIQLPGVTTSLFMPATSSLYVGNHEGWINFFSLKRYDEQGSFLHGRWAEPILELRVSQQPITAIAGDEDGDECLWVERHITVAQWSTFKQRVCYLEHKYLPHCDYGSGCVTNDCYITALDRHPYLPLYVIAVSNNKVLLYDAKAELFYPTHNGFLAGFDSDGYLIILEYQEKKLSVKRYSFIDLHSYSLKQLVLCAKIKQKGIGLDSVSGPWRDIVDSLSEKDKKRLRKNSKEIIKKTAK